MEGIEKYYEGREVEISRIQLPTDWEKWLREEGLLRSYEFGIELGLYRLRYRNEYKANLIKQYIDRNISAENKLKTLFYFEKEIMKMINSEESIPGEIKTTLNKATKDDLFFSNFLRLILNKNDEMQKLIIESKQDKNGEIFNYMEVTERDPFTNNPNITMEFRATQTPLEAYQSIISNNKELTQEEIKILQLLFDHPIEGTEVISDAGDYIRDVKFDWDKYFTMYFSSDQWGFEIDHDLRADCDIDHLMFITKLASENGIEKFMEELKEYNNDRHRYLKEKFIPDLIKNFEPDFLKDTQDKVIDITK